MRRLEVDSSIPDKIPLKLTGSIQNTFEWVRSLLRGGYLAMITTLDTHTLKIKSTPDADRTTDGESIYQETDL